MTRGQRVNNKVAIKRRSYSYKQRLKNTIKTRFNSMKIKERPKYISKDLLKDIFKDCFHPFKFECCKMSVSTETRI